MPPYIDEYGNSLVEDALASIQLEREQWKRDLSPEKFQYRISQHPINIDEAFANRKVSKFPLNLVISQMNRIQDKEYPYELLELSRGETGKIEWKETRKLPISEFPITKNTEDKTGCIVVWERPIPDPEFGMYYASIDPVSEGKTTTSESLCSIYIYKNPVEVTRIDRGETETFIERDKIVAAWCGRFDDLNKTHERLEMMIEWYNAWTIVENNISTCIKHMIDKKKQRFLVPKSQIMFLKDLGSNNNVFQEYGWRNTGTLFRNHMLSYLIEYLNEELDVVTKDDGTIVKTVYGVERIPDIMAMKEMQAYTDELNVVLLNFRVARAYRYPGCLNQYRIPFIRKVVGRWVVVIRRTDDAKSVLDYVLIPKTGLVKPDTRDGVRFTDAARDRLGFDIFNSPHALSMGIHRKLSRGRTKASKGA